MEGISEPVEMVSTEDGVDWELAETLRRGLRAWILPPILPLLRLLSECKKMGLREDLGLREERGWIWKGAEELRRASIPTDVANWPTARPLYLIPHRKSQCL